MKIHMKVKLIFSGTFESFFATFFLISVRRFYQYFDQLRALRMWKMQLLDENHLLIKYASEEVVTLRSSEPNSQASFFVVYNFKSTEVVAVYENTSEDLLNMFENYCDFFRNTNVHDDKLRSYQRGKKAVFNLFPQMKVVKNPLCFREFSRRMKVVKNRNDFASFSRQMKVVKKA